MSERAAGFGPSVLCCFRYNCGLLQWLCDPSMIIANLASIMSSSTYTRSAVMTLTSVRTNTLSRAAAAEASCQRAKARVCFLFVLSSSCTCECLGLHKGSSSTPTNFGRWHRRSEKLSFRRCHKNRECSQAAQMAQLPPGFGRPECKEYEWTEACEAVPSAMTCWHNPGSLPH